MSVIVVNNFCDSIQKIRLFDSKSQLHHECRDLRDYTQFSFLVFEPGIEGPIIEIGNNDISTSAEYRGYALNMVNVRIKEEHLKGLIPNPYNKDRVREFRLFAIDEDGTKQLLQQDCFYIEANLMGTKQ